MYTIHGVIGIFIAIPCFFMMNPLIGIALIILAAHCFFFVSGIEIDVSKKRYRKYSALYNFNFGEWKEFGQIARVELMLSIESSRLIMPLGHGLGGNAQFYGQQGSLKSKTYDIVLTESDGKNELFYEFLEYDLAKKCFRAITESLQVEAHDKVAEKIAENKLKRSGR